MPEAVNSYLICALRGLHGGSPRKKWLPRYCR